MTITISQQAYWDLFVEIPETERKCDRLSTIIGEQWEMFDSILQFPSELGTGFYGEVQLREGLSLAIIETQLYDDLILHLPEREHPLEYTFYISNPRQNNHSSVHGGKNTLWGSGLAPKEKFKSFQAENKIEINVHIHPEIFCLFMGKEQQEIPPELTHLVRKTDEEYYSRSSNTTSAMEVVLQQILNCPYQGMMKRMYLESKVLELMVLLVEQDVAAHQAKHNSFPLKAEDVQRIHSAKEILLQNLDNPPSLIELSRQVGLNDCTLKRGFRLVFGTTVFGYLHHHRLEQARKLLVAGETSISQAARSVGFASRSYFATAFRKKFGINPKEFLLANARSSLEIKELIS
jgi:AraC-like DNA-binding protein